MRLRLTPLHPGRVGVLGSYRGSNMSKSVMFGGLEGSCLQLLGGASSIAVEHRFGLSAEGVAPLEPQCVMPPKDKATRCSRGSDGASPYRSLERTKAGYADRLLVRSARRRTSKYGEISKRCSSSLYRKAGEHDAAAGRANGSGRRRPGYRQPLAFNVDVGGRHVRLAAAARRANQQ
jgi:hypothetical protein